LAAPAAAAGAAAVDYVLGASTAAAVGASQLHIQLPKAIRINLELILEEALGLHGNARARRVVNGSGSCVFATHRRCCRCV
jgi:hypothetical protein